jgi:signal transduction histidine kinase
MHHLESHNQNITPETEKNTQELLVDLQQAQKQIVELRLANRQKDELLSIATHQMRTNIAAIRGHASLINEGDLGPISPEIAETVKIISVSAESLSKTVNDFLDLSKMELGEMRYYRKDFDLVDLVTEVVNELKKTIADTGLELRLNISQTPLNIHGDKAKFKHVLVNLVDNACKYTKQGYIEISLGGTGNGKILLSIKDSGLGIKAETIPLLFQKFSRDVEANKANIHGTGLGLYIARKMVEAQNGRIWAESAGHGHGSKFCVEIPTIVA